MFKCNLKKSNETRQKNQPKGTAKKVIFSGKVTKH